MSLFSDALAEFAKGFGKKRKPTFVQEYLDGLVVDPDNVLTTIKNLEYSTSHTKLRRTLEPVIQAMVDYTGVLDTLCQADPMPTAVVWGALRAFVGCCSRFVNLYTLIRSQLGKLIYELSRLKKYERLFGQCPDMQALLKASYLNILSFWAKVESQCRHSSVFLAMKSLTSFSTKRIDDILAAIARDGNNIAALVPLIQEELFQEDRKDAAEEKQKAELARTNLLLVIQNQEDEMRLRDQERQESRKKVVRLWIQGGGELNESNDRLRRRRATVLSASTGIAPAWLLQSENFKDWLAQKEGSHSLWLRGGCGTGKSVACSYAISHVKSAMPTTGVAFQFYSFDEQFSTLTVFRNIAEQLYDQLYEHEDDVSDLIHDLALNSRCGYENLTRMIKLLVSELSQTYIFVDGLDEECTNKARWDEASEVVTFLRSLADECGSTVSFWCSSQDRYNIFEMLKSFRKIQLDKTTNSGTIEMYFAKAVSSLDTLDIDPGTKIVVLQDLKNKARGNFLWATLMIETIKDVTSLQDLQEKLNNASPSDFEKYYARKIESIQEQHRSTVSKILSCIVYAKRPLLLEELCDAIGACHTDYGQKIDSKTRLLQNMVLKLCSTLVEVAETTENGLTKVCSLSHAAVRTFLVKNPNILCQSISQDEGVQDDLAITPQRLASICLTYLSQPCYKSLLRLRDSKFQTKEGTDIEQHHLLTYAAKYWGIHADDMVPEEGASYGVTNFIKSRQFLTLLQIQSLFVEGQFKLWYSVSSGLGFKRVFPSWFSASRSCDNALADQYSHFVGEWGYLLDQYTSRDGSYPGEMERCLWGTLGSQNFLYQTTKHLTQTKSFSFVDRKASDEHPRHRYFECINSSGDAMQVFRWSKCETDKLHAKVRCERWKLHTNHRPEIKSCHSITIPIKCTDLYRLPLSSPIPGRPPLISCTPDFRYVRIGSQVFIISDSGEIAPMPALQGKSGYFEEMASSSRYIAVARRRTLTENHLANRPGLDDTTVESFGAFFSELVETITELVGSQDNKDSSGSSSSSAALARSSNASSRSSSSSRTALSDMSEDVPDDEHTDNEVEDSDDELSMASVQSLSARESWSEGSTALRSDEEGDEDDQWNDWASDHSLVDIKSTVSDDSDIKIDDSDIKIDDSEEELDLKVEDADEVPETKVEEFEESAYGLRGDMFDSDGYAADSSDEDILDILEEKYGAENMQNTRRVVERFKSQLDGDAAQTFRQIIRDGDTDSEASSEDSYDGAAKLDGILEGEQQSLRDTPAHQRGKLVVYDTKSGESTPIFRYEQACPNLLFDSPPIFHPTIPLLVWPLGKGEILFANFTENSYYTRTLRCSAPYSCHISIQGRFSPCGEYLHLGALEAREDAPPHLGPVKPYVHVSFSLSTHRLSKRKTARSPPRLVFRTFVPLDSADKLAISPLPYTLTWTPEHVYVSKSRTSLQVIRVPLLRPSKEGTASKETKDKAEVVVAESHARTDEIFLPNSTLNRKVHYFPPSSVSKSKDKSFATVVIGSLWPSLVEGGVRLKYKTAHPLGLYVDEEKQLGGWKVLDGVKCEATDAKIRPSGRLHGKYEKFDLVDDCDIVPLLV